MQESDLVDHVESAKSIASEEKESGMHWTAQDDTIRISSYQRGMITGLLQNRMFEADYVITENDDGKFRSVDAEEYDEEHPPICGIVGDLPIGSLTIKNTERKTTTPSAIVSTGTVDEDTFN